MIRAAVVAQHRPAPAHPPSGGVCGPTAARSGGESARLDAVKGIFILLIVVGHNHTLSLLAGEVRGALYLVHVTTFLYLPFLCGRRAWDAIGWADCLVRYGWPMVVFSCLYAGLFALFGGRSPVDALAALPDALVAMSARAFEVTTGLQSLWFLPALIGLRLTLKALSRPHAPSGPVLLVTALAAHLCVGLLPEAWLWTTPLGWPIVAYMLFPGLVVHALSQGGFQIPPRHVVPALAAAAILAYLYRMSGPIGGFSPSAPIFTVGKLEVPSIVEPVKLLAADAAQILVLFSALSLCGLAWVQALFSGIGRRSLEIYLFHQPIYVALLALAGKLGFGVANLAVGLALLVLTLVLSLAAARLLATRPLLRRFVFPAGMPMRRTRVPGPADPDRTFETHASSPDPTVVR